MSMLKACTSASHQASKASRMQLQPCRLSRPQRHARGARTRLSVLAGNQGRKDSSVARDTLKKARTGQIQATDLLAQLLQAPNAQATAAEHAESLTEEFFIMSSTYLEMARKEGNAEVTGKLEQVLKIAMEAKQKTLRPEIQLLNSLLACNTPAERKKVFASPDTRERLTMNDRYFFTNLLDRMIKDVGQQQSSRKQAELSQRLHQIKTEAERVAARTL